MKRLVSIFFLLLFLFNAGGYYMLYWLCSIQAENAIEAKIESEDYTQAEEITLSIPLALPYSVVGADQDFEKMKGGFEFKGEHFKLVKQKLQNDTLFLVCIKNIKQQKIDSSIADYSKTANDLPTNTKQAQNLLSKLFKDFQSHTTLSIPEYIQTTSTYTSHHEVFNLLSRDTPVVAPPPENIS